MRVQWWPVAGAESGCIHAPATILTGTAWASTLQHGGSGSGARWPGLDPGSCHDAGLILRSNWWPMCKLSDPDLSLLRDPMR